MSHLTERQEQRLHDGTALDIEVIGEPVVGLPGLEGCWKLHGYWDDVEYLWGSTGEYAMSIGRTEDGQYFAAKDDRFKKLGWTDQYLLVWYR